MPKDSLFLTFSILLFLSLSVLAQNPANHPDRLFSPSVGQEFYETAYEIAKSEDINRAQTRQAIIFLAGTTALDNRANHILPDMLELVSQYPDVDYSSLIFQMLSTYVDESVDLEITKKVVRYLLERLSSREKREQLLGRLLQHLGGKNAGMDSELATSLGLLMAEKADLRAAAYLFMRAYNTNKYNKLAFAKLVELASEQIEPAVYLERLRLALGENPLNFEAAFAFAEYAEKLQLYQTAADAYEYCAALFSFLYPSEDLPNSIYHRWIISSYNTQRDQHQCLQLAEQLRQSGRFDLLVEAVAGKAAAKIGDNEKADRILRAAEDKAVSYFDQITKPEEIAWFYCFAAPYPDKALTWANKAYSADPNSVTASAILAYSLLMNGQTEWGKTIIDNYNYEHNQIGSIALAQIQLAAGQKDMAIKTLKSAIAIDPATLAAQRAKEILSQQGGEYMPAFDPDIILTAMIGSFRDSIVPEFTRPEDIISVQFSIRGGEFAYGNEFDGTMTIANNSSQYLVVSETALFTGHIRVDANVTGDINKKIPNLISRKIRPALPIKPGSSILVPLRLFTGELRSLLLTHPQASLDIEFTAFIDPVSDALNGQGVTNKLSSIEPARAAIKRPGVKLTSNYLQNRLNSLARGRQGQKIKTAKLFAGLLMEQLALANREPLYKFIYADWMPDLLTSALVKNLNDEDWVVRVHAMTAISSLPLDYELINAVSESMDDTHWPARLMALWLLAKRQDSNFKKVLDYSAKYDSNQLVRDMAIALGGTAPEVQQPSPQPPPGDSANK